MKNYLKQAAVSLAIVAVFVGLVVGVHSLYGQAAPGVSQLPASQPSDSLASFNATTQGANIAATAFYTSPAANALGGAAPFAGKYRFTCYAVVTRAATTSSTLPSCGVTWIDADTGVSETVAAVSATNAGNALGSFAGGMQIVSLQPGSVVSISTASFASSGATSMQYAVRASLEYIGN